MGDPESDKPDADDDARLRASLGPDYAGLGSYRATMVALKKRYDQKQIPTAGRR